MRVLNWALESQKTVLGKTISVILSLALVFSCSAFFYNANAFAEEQKVESGSEITVETEEEETLTIEDENKSEEPGTEAPKQDPTESAPIQKAAVSSEMQTSGQDENGSTEVGGAESEEADSEPTNQEESVSCIEFNEETKTLIISGYNSVTKEMVSSYKKNAEKVIIKEVGCIEKESFAEFGMKSLEIANTDHVCYAFRSCTNLEDLVIDNVRVIDTYAFYNPASLKKATISNVTTMNPRVFEIFQGKTELTDLVLSNIDIIPDYLFQNCNKLLSVSFNNIGTIGFQAFMNCANLTSLDLNEKVKRLGASAFLGCTGLTELHLNGVELGAHPFYGCTGLKSVVIENVDTLGQQAFTGCTGLETVSLSNVGTIGVQAFSMYGNSEPACTSLKAVSMVNVKNIGDKAFLSCTGIESVSMTNIGTIGTNAFASCKGIESVSMTDVGTIGQYAFYNCNSLQTASMTNIEKIVNYAFWGCSNLGTIDSLSNVKTSIGGFAFYGCSSLKGLTVNDLTKMGYIGSNDEIMKRVQAILAGKFNLDDAESIKELGLEEGWAAGEVGKSSNWNAYDNGTQIVEQARWSDENAGVAEVKVDAYYTGEKQMDYIFVADLSGSMAQLGNAEDNNARFYDMQSKLLDMTGKLLGTPGYDCRVSIVSFGGLWKGTQTVSLLPFTKDLGAVKTHISKLEPLNENTDYGLGLEKALEVVNGQHNGRNTVVVFLSDGYPTAKDEGSITVTDAFGTRFAKQIKDAGVPIYGVLHSPTSGSRVDALKAMNGVCDTVYESVDTESFGEAMNSAFASAYGNNTITIPVNARDFNIDNLSVSAGTVEYNNGVITWTLSGMPFTQHTLKYNMNLTEGNVSRVGTYEYGLNNGDARFGESGASAGISLTLSRTVNDLANADPRRLLLRRLQLLP